MARIEPDRPRSTRPPRRTNAEARPEFVFLGLVIQAPGHGYDLAKRFKSTLAGLWRLSESQLYATLGRLEAKGLIEGDAEASRPEDDSRVGHARRVLRATAAGREAFFSWLRTPGDAHPRSLRLEFLTRLFFTQALEPTRYDAVVRSQRDALALALAETEARAAELAAPTLAAEAAAFSAGQLRAALDWLDGLARRPRPSAGPGESGLGRLS